MAQATETFAVGADQFTVAVEIDLTTVWLISGDFAGTIPSGQIGFINGDVNLTGDLIVEGLLTGIDTFTLTGNGFQLLVQNGGQVNLQGVPKSGWLPWGENPIGWQTNDYLAVAPTKVDVFGHTAVFWSGAWGTRPVNSPDVTLPNGQIVKPEVSNLIRSITLKNLSRIHFHDGAGVQILKYLAVVDSGVPSVLAKYPIHFHLNGEDSRGSLLEGVAVVNGKNHAFVVHGSHGVTLRDCVANNTTDDPYWWDPPPLPLGSGITVNNSNDVTYDHCLAMYVKPPAGSPGYRLNAFQIGAGTGNSVTGSVACCVQGQPKDSSGFTWPESGSGTWVFNHNASHNNRSDGIFTWQNGGPVHLIEDFVAYNNGLSGIEHGAYTNVYAYKRCVIKGGSEAAFKLHARGPILLEDIITDGQFHALNQQDNATQFVTVRRCTFTSIYYNETVNGKSSKIRYEDVGLPPGLFNMAAAFPASIAEIYQAGVLTHRWTGGVWT